MSRAVSVKKRIVGKAPTNYEAYFYTFRNINDAVRCSVTGKIEPREYTGWHKGDVEDGYHMSSTCDEFEAVFKNPDSNLEFEVFAYGSATDMYGMEYAYLRDHDAINNPRFYNKSLGGGKSHCPPDPTRVAELVKRINSGEFRQTEPMHVNDLYQLERLQVREEDDADHARNIKEKIDDAGSSLQNTNPVVLFENMYKYRRPGQKRYQYQNMVGDGNHTILGTKNSKYGDYLHVDLIPKSVWEMYTDEELRMAMLEMNPLSQIVRKSTTPKDIIKLLVKSFYGRGREWWTGPIREWIARMEFTGEQIKYIKRKTREEIKNLDSIRNRPTVWKDYTTSRYENELFDKQTKLTNKDTVVLTYSSLLFDWRNLVDSYHLYTGKNSGKKIRIILHHKTPTAKDKWDRKADRIEDQLNVFIRTNSNIMGDIQIIEMETEEVNEIGFSPEDLWTEAIEAL